MYSLYGKLFKYREGERRSPREDYLTECFADFFNRLSLPVQGSVVSRLFIPPALQSWFEQQNASISSYRIETQHPIPSGRIDLVLFANAMPLVAIENKIAAPLGEDQLATYGRWVKKSALSSGPAIVCLLTHTTRPPDDFEAGGGGGGLAIPHVARWHTVYLLLQELADDESNPADVRLLAAELLRFLGESNMSSAYAGRDEMAAALLYLRAGSRMDNTFSSIYSHIKSLDGCFRKSESVKEYSLKFDTEFKLIWGWAYLSHLTLPGLFIGYGIALEPSTIFRQGSIPDADSAFVCLGADDKRSIQAVRAAKDEPDKRWTFAEISNWVTIVSFKPLHSFLFDPESFAPKMISWIDEEAEDFNTFVKNLK